MAVRIDIDALRGEAGALARDAADTLRKARQPVRVDPAGGGASGVFRLAGEPPCETWVGVTAAGFTVECDCAAGADELCAHAAALTAAAVEDGFDWSSAATPPSAVQIDPRVAELVDLARTVPAGRLAWLVGEWAAGDRVLASRLRGYAGRLAAPSAAELADVGRTIDSIAGDATNGYHWDLYDVVKAGQAIVEELRVLAQRPAAEPTLLVVERAARVWDGLAGYLYDAWETYEVEPGEIGGAIRAVHLSLCEQLGPDPDELVARLTDIVAAAEVDSCLDEPWEYVNVLGPDRVKALRRR